MAMNIENNLKYEMQRNYLLTGVYCPETLNVDKRCKSEGINECENTYTPIISSYTSFCNVDHIDPQTDLQEVSCICNPITHVQDLSCI